MVNKSYVAEKSVTMGAKETRQDQESHFPRPSEPILLLMAGFAGVGKTTLAKKLNESLGWKMLSKDDLKLERLKNGEEVEQAGWNAFNDLFELIKQKVIIDGESVIIDTSNEMPFIFDNIKQVQQQMEEHCIRGHLKVLLCFADKEIRERRLFERGSMFSPHVTELPTILDDSELLTRFNHLLLKEKMPQAPSHPLNNAELAERLNHLLKDAELPEHFNHLLKDAELPEHFTDLLRDTELLQHFNHILRKEQVYIVDTNSPLDTYAPLVLAEVLSEFKSSVGEEAYY